MKIRSITIKVDEHIPKLIENRIIQIEKHTSTNRTETGFVNSDWYEIFFTA